MGSYVKFEFNDSMNFESFRDARIVIVNKPTEALLAEQWMLASGQWQR